MIFEADGTNKNDWVDILKFGTVRLNLLTNFPANCKLGLSLIFCFTE